MQFRRFAGILGLAVGASLMLAGSANAGTVYDLVNGGPTTLDKLLIAGNTAVVGNLSFTFSAAGFSSVATGGTSVAPAAANITVSAFNTVAGEPGLFFQGSWSAFDGTADTHIGFTVTTLDGSALTDDYLATTGKSDISSEWFVDESITNAFGASLGNNEVSLTANPNTETLTDTQTFSPQSSLTVSKDISLTSTTGVATISDVYQGFSTTAVPPDRKSVV